MSIQHPTAIIDPQAELGKNVTVKPYAIIEGNTQIGENRGSHRGRPRRTPPGYEI